MYQYNSLAKLTKNKSHLSSIGHISTNLHPGEKFDGLSWFQRIKQSRCKILFLIFLVAQCYRRNNYSWNMQKNYKLIEPGSFNDKFRWNLTQHKSDLSCHKEIIWFWYWAKKKKKIMNPGNPPLKSKWSVPNLNNHEVKIFIYTSWSLP